MWVLLCVAVAGGLVAWLRAQDQPTTVVVPVQVDDQQDQNATPMVPDDSNATDQTAPADDSAQTALPGQIDNLGQTNVSGRRTRRYYRRRPGSMSGGDFSGGAESADAYAARYTNGPARPDSVSFKIVTDRNIFDPNRRAGQTFTPTVHIQPSDYVTLVGVMSYDKGTFAFFDGNSSDYQAALKQAGTIAGYTVTDIAPNSVKLSSGTNKVELQIGMQLRREQGGPWRVTTAPVTIASSSAPTPTMAPISLNGGPVPVALPGGPQSDILIRLMKQREQE